MFATMRAAVALQLLLASSAQAQSPLPVEVDCALRELALDYGSQLLTHTKGGNDTTPLAQSLFWPVDTCGNKTKKRIPPRKTSPVNAAATCGNAAQNGGAANFYVSANDGDDGGDGTKTRPFKTLKRAQTAVQRSPRSGGTNVFLRAGLYELHETLVFTAKDSGLSAEAPVVWQAYEGEAVTISGGTQLKGLQWTAASLPNASKVLKTTLSTSMNFSSLFVGGIRAVRARWPNGDPSQNLGSSLNGTIGPCIKRVDKGEAQKRGGFPPWTGQCFQTSGRAAPHQKGWSQSGGCPGGKAAKWQWPTEPKGISGNKSRGGQFPSFSSCTGGAAERYDPPFNAWCCGGGSNVDAGFCVGGPAGGSFQALGTVGVEWSNTDRAVAHIFQPLFWGWWAFQLEHASTATGNATFSKGGWQEARGGGMGGPMYVENILEELDVEREWYLARDGRTLYYYPRDNETSITTDADGSATVGVNATVTAVRLETLLRIEGTKEAPVKHLSFANLNFAHSATTYMEPYEVPSGGDWAVHRGAAVELEGVENICVAQCSFDQPGGNGILLSNYARNNSILGNDFGGVGDSAIVSLGRPQREDNGQDHTDGLFPAGNRIAFNHVHDYGLYGKQTSCYFQSKSCGNVIEYNLCYNGPRAGLQFDDGFNGRNTVRGNLVFNAMRESNDGGPFNMWDRTAFVTPEYCQWGSASVAKHEDVIEHNFFLMGPYFGGNYGLDFDDGTRNMTTRNNLVYGGGNKDSIGQDKTCGPGNVFFYPEFSDQIATFDPFQGCSTSYGAPITGEVYSGNTCIAHDEGYFYAFNDSNKHPTPQCDLKSLNTTIPFLANNTFYSPSGEFLLNCQGDKANLQRLQALGYELGSVVHKTPPVSELMAIAKGVLLQPPSSSGRQ